MKERENSKRKILEELFDSVLKGFIIMKEMKKNPDYKPKDYIKFTSWKQYRESLIRKTLRRLLI